jgi:hypothetical protein
MTSIRTITNFFIKPSPLIYVLFMIIDTNKKKINFHGWAKNFAFWSGVGETSRAAQKADLARAVRPGADAAVIQGST